MKITNTFIVLFILLFSCQNKVEVEKDATKTHPEFSGIYPHLAYYNNEGECGTGAVVPWAGKLWIVTYGPHKPHGSSDKLYEISEDLEQIVRQESIGGTPADRMIHKESDQLFIGPYAINNQGKVGTIPYSEAPGRYTGLARHLTQPAEMLYIGTMEEGFYEVDVNSLKTNLLYEDGNIIKEKKKDTSANQDNNLLPGAHGKGLYSGQGVMVYSNNGEPSKEALKQFDIESGVLAEWDGKDWKVVRRNQFVEVTGPGGIYGNPNPETDPIWATGWDHKSVILGTRDNGKWSFFRLPKASHSYDGAHGWNTEWPRIRDIGTAENPDYLMTMHGMFWKFPQTFKSDNTAGIRPRSAYLKVIGDYTRWNGQLVFGCDDSAQKEFLNKRKVKGGIEGPGQSNSNLWFTDLDKPDQLGPNTASGAVWLNEKVEQNKPSEPFLFAGWAKRNAWIQNQGKTAANFTLEVDRKGDGTWTKLQSFALLAGESTRISFKENEAGEWIRVISDKNTTATAHFSYSDEGVRNAQPNAKFNGLAKAESSNLKGGLLYGLGDDRRVLGMAAKIMDESGLSAVGYYELDAQMNLTKKEDSETHNFINEKFAIPENVISVEESSVLIVDDQNRRWRLPLGDPMFDGLINSAQTRICREVATERDLLNCHGTFYELPAENADGFAKIRPVSSHDFKIHDYASYRGLLVMTGIDTDLGKGNDHIIISEDKNAALWAGTIDDLWEIGKPTGKGGPWKESNVYKNIPSDPYLIGFYDKKTVSLSHDQNKEVTFILEAEPVGHGPWMVYKEIQVPAGETINHEFPSDFQARWIRVKSDSDAKATAWFVYE